MNRIIIQIIKELNYLIRGWVNYFRISDMKKFLTKEMVTLEEKSG